jgi:hypothetical protein
MSTLKTNNIEHLDASTPAIQVAVGGGVNITGVTTVGDNLTIDGVNRNITTGVGQTVGFGTDISIGGNLKSNGNSFVFPSSGGTLDRLERAGNILQVVQGSTSTEVLVSTTTYTPTGLQASITPTSTSSKILLLVSVQYQCYQLSNLAGHGTRVKRGSTVIKSPIQGAGGPYEIWRRSIGVSDMNYYDSLNYQILDSPATTSSITYSVEGATYDSSSAVKYQSSGNDQNQVSTITLIEVAG